MAPAQADQKLLVPVLLHLLPPPPPPRKKYCCRRDSGFCFIRQEWYISYLFSPYPPGHFVYSKDRDKTRREWFIINGGGGGGGSGSGSVHRFSETGHKGYKYGLKWF